MQHKIKRHKDALIKRKRQKVMALQLYSEHVQVYDCTAQNFPLNSLLYSLFFSWEFSKPQVYLYFLHIILPISLFSYSQESKNGIDLILKKK